jgi:hypothetical protein
MVVEHTILDSKTVYEIDFSHKLEKEKKDRKTERQKDRKTERKKNLVGSLT